MEESLKPRDEVPMLQMGVYVLARVLNQRGERDPGGGGAKKVHDSVVDVGGDGRALTYKNHHLFM